MKWNHLFFVFGVTVMALGMLPAVWAAEKAPSLDGAEWQIQLTPTAGKRKTPVPDTLTFEKGKIRSEWLSGRGFPLSNYTVTLQEDGTVVWETMQSSEKEGLAFWRGEVSGSAMRGILSKHPPKGDPYDYSFVGERTKILEEPPPPQPPAQEVAPPPKPKAKKSGKR